ncbi:DNA-binding HxlR family transcriptional regulator [Methanococcus maripaludis]|uniref:DNA-binding HxlR family transcriptional regulator n=1 Tax=Methanococcus maripaludis TaxID=39152 RepID=A0A7J9NMV9_METMI|nr:helix-turn-helix domain-containing protein [Methanococcus maripaludis]MBA2846476.1 DNA-binding HxlR family transcriptional regulator [Methanococcus maripaludis]
MLFKLLAKKYVKDILFLLKDKDEVSFKEILEMFGIDKSNLSKLMKELEKNYLVSRREETHELKIPKSFFKLTKKGNNAIKLYELEEKIQSGEEISEDSVFVIKGNNNQNNIIGNNNRFQNGK